jgi:fibronectin type 3 domain-containing protein
LLAVNVTNYQYSISTLGANTNEVTLTPLNVNSTTFGVKATLSVDGMVTAQPLYVAGLNITIGANQGVHNVVFVATEHDSVYAFDADNYTLLWHSSFLSNVGASGVSYINPKIGAGVTITSVPSGDVNTSDISPEIGVVATPTINLSTNTMYLTPKTKEVVGSNEFAFLQLYALNLSNGLLQTSIGGGAITIAETQYNSGYNYISGPSVNGTGDGSVSGVITFNALRQMDRPAVTLDPNGPNGTSQIVLAFASHGDNIPYHGWVLTYNASTLALTGVFNATPDGSDGATWQAGGPVVVDSSGNLFFETGNGTFGNNTASPPLNAQGFPTTPNYGDAVIKIQFTSSTTQSSPGSNGWGLQLVDYFSPWNTQNLNTDDTDLASSGLLVLPASEGTSAHPELLIARGKSGVVYVLDANNLGKFNSSTDQVVEEISPAGGYWSNPAYWNGNLYGTASGSVLQQFTVTPGQISTSPVASSSNSYGFPGATGTISANGTINGVIWQYSYNGNNGSETLEAYNASNVSSLLYTGPSVSGVKMTVPIVANGQLFAGENGHLQVYGLLSTPTSVPPTPTNLAATGVASLGGIQLTWTRGATTSANLETDFEIWRSTDPAGQDNFTMVGTASAGATSFVDTSAAPGETYYYSVRGVNPVGHSVSTSAVMAITPLGVFGIWTDTDVGGPLPAGSASFSNNTITISGGGSDIFGAAGTNSAPVDQFNFAYQPVTYSGAGNQAIVAEVSNQTNTNVWAKAGVMIRDSLGAGGQFADAVITPGNGAVFQYRPSDGASAAWNNTSATLGSGPYWVMLIRNGNTITGYENTTDSSNLATWTNLGSETFASLPSTVYFGMAVTSHNNGTLSSARFNDVVIGSPASPLPLAPSNLQVVVGTGSQLNLAWTDATNANADGYVVYRALGNGSFQPVATLSPTATSYFDTALTNGATYSYFIEASNTSGNSTPTNAVTTTIPVPPGTPTDASGVVGNLTVSNLTSTGVTLSWQLPDSRDLAVNVYRRDTTTSLYSLVAALPAGTTTYSVSGLGPNTDHDFNVQTYDAGGFSGAASAGIVTPPLPPTGLAASAGNNRISLTWTAPAPGFDSYTYSIFRGMSPGGENATPIAIGLTSASYADGTATPGQPYYYVVKAVDTGGPSAPSNEVNSTATGSSVPAPASLTATVAGTQINLSWSSVSVAMSYNVYRGTSPGGEGATPFATGLTGTTFSDPNLQPGLSYYYDVTSVNGSGEGAPSVEAIGVLAPSAPTNVSAALSGANPNDIAVTWTASAGAASYNIFRGKTPGGEGSTPYASGVTGTTFVDSGAATSPGYSYYYEVVAINVGGQSAASTEVFFATPLPAPTTLTAVIRPSGNVSLSWSISAGATSYNVYRASISGSEGTVPLATGLGSPKYVDSSVGNGGTFYYEVTALAPAGDSVKSGEASVTFIAAAPKGPTNLIATSISTNHINLSWTASVGATGYNIFRGTSIGGEGPTPINSAPLVTTSFGDVGLIQNTRYYYTVRAVDASGAGPASNEAAAATQQLIPTATVTPLTPNTVTTGPAQLQIVFNEPVSDFTISSLSFSRSGGPNLLTAAQTLTTSDDTTFMLGNLSSLDVLGGTYTLTFTAAGSNVVDGVGTFAVANASGSFVVNPVAPEVNAIYVSSSDWNQNFLNYLASNGLGDAQLGYRLLGGPNQLGSLPWINVNIISVVFSRDVNINTASLALVGSPDLGPAPALGGASFTYNSSTFTAQWVFLAPLPLDKYLLSIPSAAVTSKASGAALDGEFVNGSGNLLPSGDSVAGGDFNFRFNILPGDADQNGVVTGTDGNGIRLRLLEDTTTANYSPLFDVNGDGVITGQDGGIVRAQLLQALPADDPSPPGQGGGGALPATAGSSSASTADSSATPSATAAPGIPAAHAAAPAANPIAVSTTPTTATTKNGATTISTAIATLISPSFASAPSTPSAMSWVRDLVLEASPGSRSGSSADRLLAALSSSVTSLNSLALSGNASRHGGWMLAHEAMFAELDSAGLISATADQSGKTKRGR